MSRESPVDHDAFVACESLDALQRTYAEAGETFATQAEFLERAQLDWREVAFAKAKEFTELPPQLPPLEFEADGVTYRVFGVIHGIVGGNDADYKQFVESALESLDHTLFENGLHHFYPSQSHTVIPDFWVLGFPGSVRMGLEVGFLFPRLLYEMFTEFFNLGRRPDTGFEAYDYNALFHAVPAETRRGLEEWPPLPSRLQIEYEMAETSRPFARLRNPYLIVPRSLFMAGFARGYAASRGLQQVNLVVGDLHTVEIQRFLEGSHADHPTLRSAEAFGRRGKLAYTLTFVLAKVTHLLLAGLTGCVIVFPVLYAIYYLISSAITK